MRESASYRSLLIRGGVQTRSPGRLGPSCATAVFGARCDLATIRETGSNRTLDNSILTKFNFKKFLAFIFENIRLVFFVFSGTLAGGWTAPWQEDEGVPDGLEETVQAGDGDIHLWDRLFGYDRTLTAGEMDEKMNDTVSRFSPHLSPRDAARLGHFYK